MENSILKQIVSLLCEYIRNLMFFYKYQSPTPLSLSMLKIGGMFFAIPSELNDPSECRVDYQIDGEIVVWERFIHSIFLYCRINLHADDIFTKSTLEIIFNSVEPITKHMRRAVRGKAMPWIKVEPSFRDAVNDVLSEKIEKASLRKILSMSKWVICDKYAKLLNDDVGIASFSLSPLNPTMWSHYADSQRGYSVIYKSEDGKLSISSDIKVMDGVRPKNTELGVTYEIGTYNNDKVDLIPVKYKKIPPKSNAFSHLSTQFSYSEIEDHYDTPQHFGETGSQFQSDHIGLFKSTDWKYEREIRAIFPSNKVLNSSARTAVIDEKHIIGVILGSKSSDNLCDQIAISLMCLHSKGSSDKQSKFYVFRASEKYGTYDFELTLLGIVGGFTIHGNIPLIMVKDMSEDEVSRGNGLLQRILDENKNKKAN